MKLKALLVTALFVAGVATSVAVAKGPPEGKGKKKDAVAASSTGTTTDKHAAKKMWVCHRTGSGKGVRLRINRSAWPAHRAHGDTELAAPTAPATTTTTTTSTTTTTTGGKQKKPKTKGAGSCSAGTTTTTTP